MGGLAGSFRAHFGHREHLYGVLLDALADDLESGGPTAQICQDHLSASRSDAIQLRLLAAIFRIVLRGDAPELVRFYPCLGGPEPAEKAWPWLRPLLVAHADELRAGLDKPPQTNEVGRSAVLAIGLFEAVRRHRVSQVRLLEPGAASGLNLNVNRYRIVGPGWSWGADHPSLVLDTQAANVQPEVVNIVDRRGCDLDPIDATTAEGARYLTSFVWPFDLARHERLAAALTTARAHPVIVDRAPASAWVAQQLSEPVDEDILTVIWTSITNQYWPPAETNAFDLAVSHARDRIRLAHISMEGVPPIQTRGGYDIVEHGPQLRIDGDVIARCHHHGVPIKLTDQ